MIWWKNGSKTRRDVKQRNITGYLTNHPFQPVVEKIVGYSVGVFWHAGSFSVTARERP